MTIKQETWTTSGYLRGKRWATDEASPRQLFLISKLKTPPTDAMDFACKMFPEEPRNPDTFRKLWTENHPWPEPDESDGYRENLYCRGFHAGALEVWGEMLATHGGPSPIVPSKSRLASSVCVKRKHERRAIIATDQTTGESVTYPGIVAASNKAGHSQKRIYRALDTGEMYHNMSWRYADPGAGACADDTDVPIAVAPELETELDTATDTDLETKTS